LITRVWSGAEGLVEVHSWPEVTDPDELEKVATNLRTQLPIKFVKTTFPWLPEVSE
jgi:hypothetical protein